MRYKILLKSLKILIYVKRLFWWGGAKVAFILAKIFSPGWRLVGLVHYKTNYFFKKIANVSGFDGRLVKRDNLQVVIFCILVVVALPQTKLYAQKNLGVPGQKTIAYSLSPADADYSLEEVTAGVVSEIEINNVSDWKTGALRQDQSMRANFGTIELGTVVAGGSALSKPTILSGVSVGGGREDIIEYFVEAGDSLGSIAGQFQISINTILWENNLGVTAYLHPGDKLRILPVTGLSHVIKRGDTLNRIANLYSVTAEDIIKQNKLKPDGSDLVAGEKIIIPNGIRVAVPKAPVVSPRNVARVAAPASSRQSPSASGFVWPTGTRLITQYFTWKHHGLDIAGGSFSTPNYAAKAGVVEKSQCGWNSGYGCVIIIDHGGGVKTLYGHNSKLLVSAGERVETGQTIGMMGNTGNVRGRTGIHLHFEVWINGARTNPFQFVK